MWKCVFKYELKNCRWNRSQPKQVFIKIWITDKKIKNTISFKNKVGLLSVYYACVQKKTHVINVEVL